MAKGVRLRLLSLRGSWVQIPPPASLSFHLLTCSIYIISCFSENGNGIKEKRRGKILFGCYCPPPNIFPICSPRPPSGPPPPPSPCCASACAGEAGELVCTICVPFSPVT